MDFYKLLGVPASASEAEIKHSFREKAKQYHPDINPSPAAADTFRSLYVAYDTLTDPFKRKVYDALLHEDFDLTSKNHAYYEKLQRRSDLRARQYAAMQYEQFEESAFSKAAFHIKQAIAFILFFAMLCIAMGCFIIGAHYVFAEKFNGAQVTGYGCWVAGAILAYISGKALLGIYEIWRS